MKTKQFTTLLAAFAALILLVAGCNTAIFGQTTTTASIMNRTLTYDFGKYVVDVTISSDTTVHWKDSKTDAYEKSKTIHINDHTALIGWYESTKTFVSLYSDFATGETYAQICQLDGKIVPFTGTLAVKK